MTSPKLADLLAWLRRCVDEDEAREATPFGYLSGAGSYDQNLAACEAYRRIIDACERRHPSPDLIFAIRALASIYSDRPGWREEWRA